MADTDDDSIAVQIDDAETVTVPVDENLKTAQEPEHIKKELVKKERKRVVPDVPQTVTTGPSPEEILAQAQAYGKQQEDARRAAEATAANERAMREQAQREAQQARESAQELEQRATNSELAIIENGIASASREIEALEGEYTRAAEAGEFSKMGTIQTKLSRAAAKLDRLESEKTSFELGARRIPTTEGRVEAPPAPVNHTEQYLSQFAPVAQNWLRSHPECMDPKVGGSAEKNSLMMSGHYAAVAKNIAQGTPEYFKVLEEYVSGAPAPMPAAASKAADIQAAEPPRRQAQVAAPVTRDPPASNGQPRSTREVRLTKDQQEMAKVSFPHLPVEQAFGMYAKNLIELEAEGKQSGHR